MTWQIEKEPNGVIYITDENGRDVCDLYHMTSDTGVFVKPNAEENAKLIVSAPEMKTMLTRLEKYVDEIVGGEYDQGEIATDFKKLMRRLHPQPRLSHDAVRQSDEYFCHQCGKRWAVDEDEPACTLELPL